jgi:hypothetical protein
MLRRLARIDGMATIVFHVRIGLRPYGAVGPRRASHSLRPERDLYLQTPR